LTVIGTVSLGQLKAINGRNVGVIERCEDLGFTLEAGQPLGISCEDVRQDFDCNLSIQVRVFGTVDLAHASSAELVNDAIVRERCADH
jgi:hypothetical protein